MPPTRAYRLPLSAETSHEKRRPSALIELVVANAYVGVVWAIPTLRVVGRYSCVVIDSQGFAMHANSGSMMTTRGSCRLPRRIITPAGNIAPRADVFWQRSDVHRHDGSLRRQHAQAGFLVRWERERHVGQNGQSSGLPSGLGVIVF